MNFIKKIFDGESDESVHQQFQKFSKGEFRNRALIRVKKSGGKFTINTSAEFANELVRNIAEKLGSNKTNVTGAIVSTLDLKDKIEFKEIKQFQGVKRYLLDSEMSGEDIISLLDEQPKAFFALSFKVDDEELKIKPKAPKSGKPGKGEEEPKADFCKLKTSDESIAKSFIFEKPEFKDAVIKHTFFIENIVIPDELKSSKDFSIIREKSRRAGRILREGEIDCQKIREETEFEA
jgi:hypothetical protein